MPDKETPDSKESRGSAERPGSNANAKQDDPEYIASEKTDDMLLRAEKKVLMMTEEEREEKYPWLNVTPTPGDEVPDEIWDKL
ncbi:hypothetical protein Hte_001161 [Hypoxylon texense]